MSKNGLLITISNKFVTCINEQSFKILIVVYEIIMICNIKHKIVVQAVLLYVMFLKILIKNNIDEIDIEINCLFV